MIEIHAVLHGAILFILADHEKIIFEQDLDHGRTEILLRDAINIFYNRSVKNDF